MTNQHLQPGVELHSGNYTYIIKKVLGQGSFGITYLATTRVLIKASIEGALGKLQQDRWEEVQVAIKEFFMKETNSRRNESSLVEGSDSQLTRNYRKKFRREAENLSSLNHPNIVKVLEVFDANNTSYYVMEYIKGKNLDECIPPDGMNEKEARRIITDIAQGLQYMHSHRMLHLDIKPKNIMIAQNGKAKLIDFGLSKQYNENDEPESSTSIGLGTPGYAPLEQSNYKQDGTFPATLDIYALGATYYKMLTGKTPPPASDVLDDGLPPLPSKLSLASVKAIESAMEPRKKNRTQNVDAWLALLGEEENNEETRVDESVATISRSESIYEMMTASLPTHHGTIGKATSKSQTSSKTRVMAIPEHLRHLMESSNPKPQEVSVDSKPDDKSDEPKAVVEQSGQALEQPKPEEERPKLEMKLPEPQPEKRQELPVSKSVESNPKEGNPFIRFLIGLVTTLAIIGVIYFIYNTVNMMNGNNKEGIVSLDESDGGQLSDSQQSEDKDKSLTLSTSVNMPKETKVESIKNDAKQAEVKAEPTKEPVRQPKMEQKEKPNNGTNEKEQQGITMAQAKERQETEAKPQTEEISNADPNMIYDTVDEMPEYPDGGMAGVMRFLSSTIEYPAIAAENGIQGRVTVQFVVNRDGSIVDTKVIRGVDPYLDKEALRVINLMPKWKPGMKDGKPVRVRYTVPVNFRLQ